MKQAQLATIEQQLIDLYRSLQIPVDASGSLQALDSLNLVHLIDKIENHFAIRISLVDLDPIQMKQHSYIAKIVAKYYQPRVENAAL